VPHVKRLSCKTPSSEGGNWRQLQQIHWHFNSTIVSSTAWFRRNCSSMTLTMRHKLNKSLGLFSKSLLGIKAIGFSARDQRPLRCRLSCARRGVKMGNAVAFSFRQRHGVGRCFPAPFQSSLRLHFTFPPAEPLTEVCRWPMRWPKCYG
jgi:hypothetical protein